MLYNNISWSQPLAFLIWNISVLRMTWLELSPSLPPKLCVDKENKILALFAKFCFFSSFLCAFGFIDCPSSVNVPDSNIFYIEVLYHETLGAKNAHQIHVLFELYYLSGSGICLYTFWMMNGSSKENNSPCHPLCLVQFKQVLPSSY